MQVEACQAGAGVHVDAAKAETAIGWGALCLTRVVMVRRPEAPSNKGMAHAGGGGAEL